MKMLMTIIALIGLMQTTFASSRLDNVLVGDADTQLEKIENRLRAISDNDQSLRDFRDQLSLESRKETKRKAGGVLIAVGAVGVVVGGVILKREPSFAQVFAAFAAIGGGVIAGAGGTAMILLNKSEVEKISAQINDLLTKNAENKKLLFGEIARYCSIQPQNKLCY